MAKFSAATKNVRPAKVVRIEADAWNRTFHAAPDCGIAIGLRGVSDGDESQARSEAERQVREDYRHEDPENATDCFNDLVMRHIVAKGICDPNDVTQPHHLLPRAEEQIRFALTSNTVRFLFEEIERLQIETSPLHPEADEDDISELIALLSLGDVWRKMPSGLAKATRRLLRCALDDMRRASGAEHAEPDEEDPIDIIQDISALIH